MTSALPFHLAIKLKFKLELISWYQSDIVLIGEKQRMPSFSCWYSNPIWPWYWFAFMILWTIYHSQLPTWSKGSKISLYCLGSLYRSNTGLLELFLVQLCSGLQTWHVGWISTSLQAVTAAMAWSPSTSACLERMARLPARSRIAYSQSEVASLFCIENDYHPFAIFGLDMALCTKE